MLKSSENKISNEKLYNIVRMHTDILEKLVKISASCIEKSSRNERAIVEIIKNLEFDSEEEMNGFLQVIDGIYDLSGDDNETGIDRQMDSLCGLWKASREKDASILISKLPDGKYVFTAAYYKSDGRKYCSAYIIGNILEKPSTRVIADGQEMAIHYDAATEYNPECILFNRTLYFRADY